MVSKKYILKKNTVYVELKENVFYVKLNGELYYAKYDFNIENTPEHHIDMMVYFIFYNCGENRTAMVRSHVSVLNEDAPIIGNAYVEVDAPPFEEEGQVIDNLSFFNNSLFETAGSGKLIMFSGGYDSVAVKILVPEAPCIYLHRDPASFSEAYRQADSANQQEVIEKTNAHVIVNNIEKIGVQYRGKIGFTAGNGYASLMIPYLSKYNASNILTGSIFEDSGIGYSSKGLSFGRLAHTATNLNTMHWSKRAGINLSIPNAGLSEVLAARLVSNSIYKDMASSCQTVLTKEEKNHCGKCFKCLRKLPVLGREGELKQSAIASGETKVRARPGPSVIYGIQKLKSDNKFFKSLDEVDVSAIERYSQWYTFILATPDILELMEERYAKFGIEPMTDKDYGQMESFIKDINRITKE